MGLSIHLHVPNKIMKNVRIDLLSLQVIPLLQKDDTFQPASIDVSQVFKPTCTEVQYFCLSVGKLTV